jgi:hypothetical protein
MKVINSVRLWIDINIQSVKKYAFRAMLFGAFGMLAMYPNKTTLHVAINKESIEVNKSDTCPCTELKKQLTNLGH